jgi:hypothetical protein
LTAPESGPSLLNCLSYLAGVSLLGWSVRG